jgi:hypothetical protein
MAMHRNKQQRWSDRSLSIVGIFLSLLAARGQGLFPDLLILWVLCLAVGIGGLLWALFNEGVFGQHLARRKILSLSIILALTMSVFVMAWSRAAKLGQPPDIKLVLIDPKSVNFILENPSGKVVNQPTYAFVLWNLDHPLIRDPSYPERQDPSPIPTTFSKSYILPGAGLGPSQLMSLPQVQPLVNEGDRLFGYAHVFCVDCKRTHLYWVYIQHGNGGWYYEVPSGQVIDMRELARQMPAIRRERDRWIDELAPLENRQPIKNWPIR